MAAALATASPRTRPHTFTPPACHHRRRRRPGIRHTIAARLDTRTFLVVMETLNRIVPPYQISARRWPWPWDAPVRDLVDHTDDLEHALIRLDDRVATLETGLSATQRRLERRYSDVASRVEALADVAEELATPPPLVWAPDAESATT